MSTTFKRFLILFSVALNIGFIITGIYSYFSQPLSHHQRHLNYAKSALKQVGLPEDKEKELIAQLETFSQKHEQSIKTFKNDRQKLIALLAKPGPLDQSEFAVLEAQIQATHDQMDQLVETHILSVRQKLGDTKGAQFFSALLDQIKSDNQLN